MKCEEVEELAGAYALQALPAETLREVEEHLASCSRHPEIAGLRAVASSLAGAAPEMEPPPALKARLMDAVRKEAPAGAAPSREAPVGWPRRLSWPRLSPYALAAALAVAVVALLGWDVYLQVSQDNGREGTVLVRTLTDSGAVSGHITYIQDEGLAVLQIDGLKSLPPDEIYQVWAISGGVPTSIGFLDVSEVGRVLTTIEADLSRAEVLAVTVEPAGGSPQPTTEPILKAEI